MARNLSEIAKDIRSNWKMSTSGQNPICKQWNKSIPRNQMLLMDSRMQKLK